MVSLSGPLLPRSSSDSEKHQTPQKKHRLFLTSSPSNKKNSLLIANIVVNSIAIAGYWSGGCCGCGYFNYYGGNGYGAGVCGYCTFWNGYQVREGEKEGRKKMRPLNFRSRSRPTFSLSHSCFPLSLSLKPKTVHRHEPVPGLERRRVRPADVLDVHVLRPVVR